MTIKSKKNTLLVLAVIATIFVGVIVFLFTRNYEPDAGVIFGVTFSQKYAEELNLDWRETYLAILDELQVSHLRLVAYWDVIEAKEGEYDFADLDWQVSLADQRGRNIMLSVGRRMPRWPECHDPAWLTQKTEEEIRTSQLAFVKEVVERYKEYDSIISWQVENEPLFSWFGHCPKPDYDFLAQEVELVRSLDQRPIVITDSGELNDWQRAASLADVLGITMYRVVWNEYLGFWDYFFAPPSIYTYKAKLTEFFNKDLTEVIVTELQMEPWTIGKPMVELTLEEQEKSFDLDRFNDNIAYVKKTGFTQAYVWGVEYWYWLNKQGYSDIWNQAKTLWSANN
jgi:hypothetical protein